jgi:hypothetical protein
MSLSFVLTVEERPFKGRVLRCILSKIHLIRRSPVGTHESSPNTVHLRNSKLSGTQMVSAGGALRS